jgi:hypothetical protein
MKFSRVLSILAVDALVSLTHGGVLRQASQNDVPKRHETEAERHSMIMSRSTLLPDSSTIKCKGGALNVKGRLYPNEYLCYSYKENVVKVFGLDQTGRLIATDGKEITWSAGVTGDFLTLQKDGNMVLYKNSKPVWATGCTAPAGTEFQLIRTFYDVEIIDSMDPDKLVWQIFESNGQESECFPLHPNTSPPVNCMDTILEKRVRLNKNEYLCDFAGLKVGMTNRGEFTYFRGKDKLWSTGYKTNGDFVIMQADGNLVVRKKTKGGTTEARWATKCPDPNLATLSLTNAGGAKVVTKDNKIVWNVDPNTGKESECYPSVPKPVRDCSKTAIFGSTCRFHNIRNYRKKYNEFELTDINIGNKLFNVTRRQNGGEPKTVTATYDNSSGSYDMDYLDMGNGYSRGCKELFGDYYDRMPSDMYAAMVGHDGDSYLPDPNYPCTEWGKMLIMFYSNTLDDDGD